MEKLSQVIPSNLMTGYTMAIESAYRKQHKRWRPKQKTYMLFGDNNERDFLPYLNLPQKSIS